MSDRNHIEGPPDPDCPFCNPADRPILFENALAWVIPDLYPVTPGHVLVIPKRHVATYFELDVAEMHACQDLLVEAQAAARADPTALGFNVGINCGVVAGQTVMHCHIHLIPRREGDHPSPRGGVRGVIPGRANYTPPGTR